MPDEKALAKTCQVIREGFPKEDSASKASIYCQRDRRAPAGQKRKPTPATGVAYRSLSGRCDSKVHPRKSDHPRLRERLLRICSFCFTLSFFIVHIIPQLPALCKRKIWYLYKNYRPFFDTFQHMDRGILSGDVQF